ncbi:MAG: PEP-CTERM-box response regulator transcription factor [Desulfuromonadales bacterium]|nr:PEP-CTERM-box response regulator transcription factor [Desulfuromonadales bacterium]
MHKLLIIEDDPGIVKQLKWGLAKDYRLLFASRAAEAMELLRAQQPRIITLDLGLPPDAGGTREGFRCLEQILQLRPLTKVIVLTGNGQRECALQAVQTGAYDYFPKPIDLPQLKVILGRAAHVAALEEENQRLQKSARPGMQELSGIFGQCPQMQEVFRMIRKVASCDVPVLILGESGTGKELVARAVHQKSLRAGSPFIPINCGAIPENLLESELFGHERGAFTGAQVRVQGKVEFAHRGTLFLDEIGELSPALQVKLLRFLQEKVIQRVGGREDIEVDARIIAATNLDIQKAIEDGSFRDDLYYRIGVVTITLPPLRERGEDIILLANLFLQRFSQEMGKKIRGFSPASLAAIEVYSWPGNVRELENKVKRSVIMCDSPVIEPPELGLAEPAETGPQRPAVRVTLKEAKNRLESEMVISAIQKYTGNVAKAAEALGISRPTIYDLMRKHGFHNNLSS